MSDKWYDHLKPSNGAEAGCYKLVIVTLLLAGAIYVNVAAEIIVTTVFMAIMAMWVYWLGHSLVVRRSKQLENTPLSTYKLRLVELMLSLIGLGAWFFLTGLSYLAAFWNWPLLSLFVSIAGLGGVIWFGLKVEPLVDFLLK
jgi:hypothetical protein